MLEMEAFRDGRQVEEQEFVMLGGCESSFRNCFPCFSSTVACV